MEVLTNHCMYGVESENNLMDSSTIITYATFAQEKLMARV